MSVETSAANDIIAKSTLARELGVTGARISQYLAQGMPQLPDGRLSHAACLAWLKGNVNISRCSPSLAEILTGAETPRPATADDGGSFRRQAAAANAVTVACLNSMEDFL